MSPELERRISRLERDVTALVEVIAGLKDAAELEQEDRAPRLPSLARGVQCVSPSRLNAVYRIIREVSSATGIPEMQISNGPGQGKNIPDPRRMAIWLARDLTGLSYTTLSDIFGSDDKAMRRTTEYVRRALREKTEFGQRAERLRGVVEAVFMPDETAQ